MIKLMGYYHRSYEFIIRGLNSIFRKLSTKHYLCKIISKKLMQKRAIINIRHYKILKKYILISPRVKNIATVPKKNNDTSENIIWQMWWQGEDDCPLIVKRCLKSVEKFYGKKRIIITEKNLHDYIKLPNYIIDKHKRGIISTIHLSDIIRLSLLYRYGGVWIDATCLLTSEIPKQIIHSDLFYFVNPEWKIFNFSPNEDILIKKCYETSNCGILHSGSNWFLVAMRGNYIIQRLKHIIFNYWRNENYTIDYLMFHLIKTGLIVNEEISFDIFHNMPIYTNDKPHILQFSMHERFNEEKINHILQQSFIHKLTYKKIKRLKHNKHNFYNYIMNSYRD